MCGKTPSSMPVKKMTGNSRPLAVCSVINVTTPPSSAASGIWSLVGDKGDLLHEVSQRAVGGSLLELVGNRLELAKVLDPRLVLRVMGRLQLGQVAGLLEHRLQNRRWASAGLDQSAQHVHRDRTKPLMALTERVLQPWHDARLSQPLREADPLALREHLHRCHGAVADPPLRSVDDAAHRHDVVRIGQHPQVGERVAHLTPLVEADTTNDLVRQPDADEDFFEDT